MKLSAEDIEKFSSFRRKSWSIARSPWFGNFILFVIVVNAFTIGLETFNISPWLKQALVYFDFFALSVYTIEAIIKITAYRRNYFTDAWNIFDFSILLICLIPTGLIAFPVQVARILRVLRVFRIFRLVSAFKQMRIIIEAIARAIPSVFWTAFLLVIVYYIFAVIGTVMFGKDFPDWFGHLGRSFYTLFQIMTLESWSMGIARPVMEVYPWAWAYFVPFVMISAFIIVNVVVGIVLDTIGQTRVEADKEELQMSLSNDDLQQEMENLKTALSKIENILAQRNSDSK